MPAADALQWPLRRPARAPRHGGHVLTVWGAKIELGSEGMLRGTSPRRCQLFPPRHCLRSRSARPPRGETAAAADMRSRTAAPLREAANGYCAPASRTQWMRRHYRWGHYWLVHGSGGEAAAAVGFGRGDIAQWR
eukprot:ctg_336.g178